MKLQTFNLASEQVPFYSEASMMFKHVVIVWLALVMSSSTLYSQDKNPPRAREIPKIFSAKEIELSKGLSNLQILRIKRHNAVIKELASYGQSIAYGDIVPILDASLDASQKYVTSGEAVFSTNLERIELYKQQLELASYALGIADRLMKAGEGSPLRYQQFLYIQLDCEIKILELTPPK